MFNKSKLSSVTLVILSSLTVQPIVGEQSTNLKGDVSVTPSENVKKEDINLTSQPQNGIVENTDTPSSQLRGVDNGLNPDNGKHTSERQTNKSPFGDSRIEEKNLTYAQQLALKVYAPLLDKVSPSIEDDPQSHNDMSEQEKLKAKGADLDNFLKSINKDNHLQSETLASGFGKSDPAIDAFIGSFQPSTSSEKRRTKERLQNLIVTEYQKEEAIKIMKGQFCEAIRSAKDIDFSDAPVISQFIKGSCPKSKDTDDDADSSIFHRPYHKYLTDEEFDRKISYLAKDYDLLIVHTGEFTKINELIPTVRQLEDDYHFMTLATSPDRSILPGFINKSLEQGFINIVVKENVYPMIYLANRRSEERILIAVGSTGIKEIKHNLKQVIRYLERKNHVR